MRAVLASALFAFALAVSAAGPPVILVHGDSLSTAYGMALELGWVALLERRLAESGHHYRVVNTSVSGDTTHGGLNRLPDALRRHRPSIVVIELGANDGLRAFPLDHTRGNLDEIVRRCQAAGAKVVLLGIRLPVNFGLYAESFHAMYAQIADDLDIALVPFFLQDVGERSELLQADGLHPRAEAQPILLDNVWPHLEPLL